jgi:hypothetical protein
MRPKLRFPLLVLAATLLGLPASAVAGTRSGTITLPAASGISFFPRTTTIKCPRGQRATGGGFLTAQPSITDSVWVLESRKIGQRSWRVSGAQLSPAKTAPLTAFAYCSADAAKTKEKATRIVVPATGGPELYSAEARCGGAGKVQAGGFLMVSPSYSTFAYLADSFRSSAKSWRSRFLSDTGTPSLTSYAYCNDEKAPKARTGSASSAMPGSNVTVLSPACKRGTKIVSGGFSAPDTSEGDYRSPSESFRIGRTWRVSEQHSDSAADTLQAIGYCA